YEDLNDVDRFNLELWDLYLRRPHDWYLRRQSFIRNPGLLIEEMRPLTQTEFNHVVHTTNRWGMRDREYPLTKPPGSLRIALLGGSQTFGVGVSDGQIFEALLEDRLNAPSTPRRYGRVELLNFAMTGRDTVQQPATLEEKVFRFGPDMVFYVAH